MFQSTTLAEGNTPAASETKPCWWIVACTLVLLLLIKLYPNLKSIGLPTGGGAVPAETKVILSSHNFDNTPSDKALETILQQMWASGADVAKIATTATDITDCARVLTLLKTSQGMPRYSLNV